MRRRKKDKDITNQIVILARALLIDIRLLKRLILEKDYDKTAVFADDASAIYRECV